MLNFLVILALEGLVLLLSLGECGLKFGNVPGALSLCLLQLGGGLFELGFGLLTLALPVVGLLGLIIHALLQVLDLLFKAGLHVFHALEVVLFLGLHLSRELLLLALGLS